MKKKTPTYNCTYEQIQGYIKQGYNQAIRDAANYSMAVPMLILRDEFGFGKQRLLKFHEAFLDLYDAINKKEFDLQEIVAVINEETGVKIVERNRR